MFEADLRNVDSLSNTNFFSLCTALISESSGIASQRQCRKERASLRFKSTAKFFLQEPGAVYICNGARIKVDRKGTSAGRISQVRTTSTLKRFFWEKIRPPFTSLHGAL